MCCFSLNLDGLAAWLMFILIMGSILSCICGIKGWLHRWILGNLALVLWVVWYAGLDSWVSTFLFLVIMSNCFTYWVGKVVARGD